MRCIRGDLHASKNGAAALLTKPIDFGTLRGEIDMRVERAAGQYDFRLVDNILTACVLLPKLQICLCLKQRLARWLLMMCDRSDAVPRSLSRRACLPKSWVSKGQPSPMPPGSSNMPV